MSGARDGLAPRHAKTIGVDPNLLLTRYAIERFLYRLSRSPHALRENVRAQLRVLVTRILRKHGYPPDKQEKATRTVLEQAALLSAEWATS